MSSLAVRTPEPTIASPTPARPIIHLGMEVHKDSITIAVLRRGGYVLGATAIALDAPAADTPAGDRFNPLRVGLDHLALACADSTELRRVAAALTAAGINNTGVKVDPTLNKEYVAFKDPDGIAWEFYMA